MRARGWLFGLVVGLVMVLASVVAACGGAAAAKFPVTVGAMPQGETWPGVYYNPVYGNLHLVEQGGNLVGRWKRTDSSHCGELSGTLEGNVLRFTWKEHTIGAIGPSGESRGTGVFTYKIPAGAEAPELDGQYGVDESSDVGQWHCVKQKNVPTDFNKVSCENVEAPMGGHDQWK